jgi:transglutaminase-like putative cysteine protease
MVKTLLPVLLAAAVAAASDAPPEPRARSFHMEYRATVKDIPAGAKHLDLWVPVPHDDPYQKIRDLRIDSSYGDTVATGPEGNAMLHLGIDNPKERTVTVRMSFDATRTEHLQPRLFGGEKLKLEESAGALAPFLKPDRLVPIDDQIRAWARDVVVKANAHTDLEMARAIYNHVVATVKYDKSGKGWGRGDIYYACEARRGNCTDFHAIFIGYARALGIPARFAIGFSLPPGRGEGQIAGYHCWAEFYAKGIGWVPVDASEAAKNPDRRQYFFGAHDENRIEFSKGRDVVLTPRQHGDPLNYFVYPYAEIDGQAFAATEQVVTYKDAIAAAPTGNR